MNRNCLDVQVSAWRDYFETHHPKPVNLWKWLNSAKYAHQVKQIRAAQEKTERDRLKATLPAITPSGEFNHREEAGLLRHSGLIQFDVDGLTTDEAEHLKGQLSNLEEVAYLGLSISGRGLWGLVPIAHPDKHRQHFEALAKDFLAWGITLDEKPKNVASLRGYSWDEEAYFNPQAMAYTKLSKYSPHRQQIGSPVTGNEALKIEACLEVIESARIDITGRYSDWFAVGCSLANEFGEAGRGYFHRVSCFHPSYNPIQADGQFTHCLKHKYRYTIATFYHLAGLYGVTYSRACQGGRNLERLASQPQPEKAALGKGKPDRGPAKPSSGENYPDILAVMKEVNPRIGELINRLGLELEI